MRVRLINTYEPVTTFYRDLVPYLASQGIEIEIFISGFQYRSNREDIDQVFQDHRIHIKKTSSFRVSSNSRLNKAFIMVLFGIETMIKTLLGPRCHLNIFLSQPPLFSIWGIVLKFVRKQPYICLVMDLYPDVAIQAGLLRDNNPLTILYRKLMKFCLKKADAVIVIGRCMETRVKSLGVEQDRIHFISNWVNECQINPIDHDQNFLRNALNLKEDFVVLYSGNMGASHYFQDLLDVARRLKEVDRIKFLFIGDGIRGKEIDAAIKTHGLKNVIRLPFQPIKSLSESLSMGDVHFVSLREGFEGIVVPSKAYSALAVGRPLIYQGSPKGEIASMIDDEKIGVVVPESNVDQLEQAILLYYNNPQLRNQEGGRALQLAKNGYSHHKSMLKYKEIIAYYDRI